MRGRLAVFIAVALTTLPSVPALAQVSPPEPPNAAPAAAPERPGSSLNIGKPPAAGDDAEVELGAPFESQTSNIALRPPAGMKSIIRAGNGDEVVQYIDDKRQWTLTVSRLRFKQAMPLTAKGQTPGLLEYSTEKLKESGSNEVLRSDVTNIGAKQIPDTAVIVARVGNGTKYQLVQQAIVQVSDTLYYTVEFLSAGSKPGTGTDTVSDDERTAIRTFNAVIDTLKPLDRADIRNDQNLRMDATRNLFLNWTVARVQSALVPEYWLRHIQDGKDVGYSYVIEEEDRRAGRLGVVIGVRSRSKLKGPASTEQVDAESFMFIDYDRKYEEWSNVARFLEEDGKKSSSTEVGSGTTMTKRIALPKEYHGEILKNKQVDDKQPGVQEFDERQLTVTYGGNATPLIFQPPVTYISPATVHLLPRLLPLKQPKRYIFATYISERRQIMRRYVDVLPEADVTLDGRKLRAIPISDRVGLEGLPTMHYMSKDGRYLGSVNDAAKITILPTDAATLQKIWTNPDLTRPKTPVGPTYIQPDESSLPPPPAPSRSRTPR